MKTLPAGEGSEQRRPAVRDMSWPAHRPREGQRSALAENAAVIAALFSPPMRSSRRARGRMPAVPPGGGGTDF